MVATVLFWVPPKESVIYKVPFGSLWGVLVKKWSCVRILFLCPVHLGHDMTSNFQSKWNPYPMLFNQCCHRRRQQHYFCKCAARFAACRSFFSFAVEAFLASGIQASNLTYIAACLYQEMYFSMRFFGQFSMAFIISFLSRQLWLKSKRC